MSRACTCGCADEVMETKMSDSDRMTDEEYAIAEKALKEINEAFVNIEPSPEEIDKELIATMYQIRIEYLAMKERMNHFEAWFANAFDRIGMMEKQICGLQQQMKIWFDGRGGIS